MKEKSDDPQIGQIFQRERNAHLSGFSLSFNWIEGDAR